MVAYLSKHRYLHDIFVSYSHGDVDQVGNSLLKDWSRQFVDLLRQNLGASLQHPISVFLDDGPRNESAVDRLAPLSEQLNTAIEGAALFQVLMSPHYLGSAWCEKELKCWRRSQSKIGGPERRTAVARIFKTDHKDWPAALKDASGEALPGWWFHARDGTEEPWGWMLGWNGLAPNEEFAAAMINLAGALRKRLCEIDEELTRREHERRQVAALQAGQVKAIYLHARDEHRRWWEETSHRLDSIGVEVKPGDPEPSTTDENESLRGNLARIASRCDAMLLVGVDRFALDDDIDLIGRDRRNYIRSRFQKYLPCAIVDCVGLQTEQRLRAARNRDIAWFDGANMWPDNLRAWLQQASQRAADNYGVRQ